MKSILFAVVLVLCLVVHPARAEDDGLGIPACQLTPKTLDDVNCAMAKRTISRSRRAAAGLCSNTITPKLQQALVAAIARAAASDIAGRPWPWDKALNLRVCGYHGAPEAVDVDFDLKISGSPEGAMDEWLRISGYTNDGKDWKFDELQYSTPETRTEAQIPLRTRAGLVAAVKKAFPWVGALKSPPLFDLATRTSTLGYREFDDAPINAAFRVRIDVSGRFEPGAVCATLVAFLAEKDPYTVLRQKEAAPHPCPAGIP